MREKSAEKNSARYRDTRVEIVVEDKETGVLKCIGRIPGYRPTYLEDCLLTQKVIRHIHSEIKHLGLSNTMAEIKKKYYSEYYSEKIFKQTYNSLCGHAKLVPL